MCPFKTLSCRTFSCKHVRHNMIGHTHCHTNAFFTTHCWNHFRRDTVSYKYSLAKHFPSQPLTSTFLDRHFTTTLIEQMKHDHLFFRPHLQIRISKHSWRTTTKYGNAQITNIGSKNFLNSHILEVFSRTISRNIQSQTFWHSCDQTLFSHT